MNRYIAYAGFSLIAVCLYFFVNPEIDLMVSKHFYNNAFIDKTVFPYNVLYLTGKIVAIAVVNGFLLLFAANFIRSKNYFNINNSKIAFVCLSSFIGPYFIIHGLLKVYLPRPRPTQIENFGGDYIFQPIFSVTECEECMSFASGHASGAFFLTVFIFIVQEKYRKICAAVILPYAFLVSYSRIVNGGHFLSDVMVGALVAILVNLIMAYVFLDEFHPDNKKLNKLTKFIDNFYLNKFLKRS